MFLYVLFFFCVQKIHCANILMVNLLPSPSHTIWNEAIVEGLLNNMHNVTAVQHYPSNINNSRYALLKLDEMSENEEFAMDLSTVSSVMTIFFTRIFTKIVCENDFQSDNMKSLLTYPKNSFDLIIIDAANLYCYLPLADHFGMPPVIAVNAFGMQPYISESLGSQTYSYIPFYSTDYTDDVNFIQRLHNFFLLSLDRLSRWYFLSDLNNISRKFYGDHIKSIEEIENHISLMLTNNNPLLDFSQPLPPHVIPVGGLHIKPPNRLSEDLQMVTDAAAEFGVIYFSMGSNIKSTLFNSETINLFVDTFAKLNQTILWKFDDERIELPKNVIAKKWYRQNDILAHPNVKLFISHCGLLSMQESIHHGVPMLCLPSFMDQHRNAAKVLQSKIGLRLNYLRMSKDDFFDAINELVNDPIYTDNVKRTSKLLKDRQNNPLDTAIFWIEYVLRNGDVKFLSPAGRYMKWYQIEDLDIFIVIFSLIFIVCYTIKRVVRCIFKKRTKYGDDQKKKV